MNDFLFFFGTLLAVTTLAAVLCVMKELFTRWLKNDWCRHDWGTWENVDYEHRICQHRFCKKCNMMEKRTP